MAKTLIKMNRQDKTKYPQSKLRKQLTKYLKHNGLLTAKLAPSFTLDTV